MEGLLFPSLSPFQSPSSEKKKSVDIAKEFSCDPDIFPTPILRSMGVLVCFVFFSFRCCLQSVTDAITKDADMLVLLDVLARDVGVIGVFTDWPATVTHYANCVLDFLD